MCQIHQNRKREAPRKHVVPVEPHLRLTRRQLKSTESTAKPKRASSRAKTASAGTQAKSSANTSTSKNVCSTGSHHEPNFYPSRRHYWW